MSRVKRAVHARKRKRTFFKAAKGYRGARSRAWRTVRLAVERAREYAYRDRKNRKRDFRRLWIQRINAAARLHGLNYSQFMHGLQQAGVRLDRKALAHLAATEEVHFAALCQLAKDSLPQEGPVPRSAEPLAS